MGFVERTESRPGQRISQRIDYGCSPVDFDGCARAHAKERPEKPPEVSRRAKGEEESHG
jgi:hypothetical protein